MTAPKLFGRAAQRRPPADEHEPDSRPAGLSAHRGTHAFSGFQTIPHFQGHLFQRRHIAGGLHDVHERFGTELCAGVIGVHFTQKGRIGLPDSLRDSLSTGLSRTRSWTVVIRSFDMVFSCIKHTFES